MSGEHFSDIESLARSTLESVADERLRDQLQRVHTHSQFYRERFDAHGVDVRSVTSTQELHRLPFVTKDDFRAEQVAHPPVGRLTVARREEIRQVHPTNGTTGKPVLCLWSQGDIEYMAELGVRALWSMGVRPGMVIHNAFSHGLWVGGVSVDTFAERLGCLNVPIGGSAGTKQHMEYIRALRPDVIIGTPSFGTLIGEHLAIQQDDLNLSIGAFGGEPGAAVDASRAILEKSLGIRAFDFYGSTELGMTLASECTAQDGLHWPEDRVHLELVDPDTKEQVSDGTPGVMVVTHLSHTGFPLIRYWTGDITIISRDPCSCGRTLLRLPRGIIGRADDMVTFKGTNFYPTQVEDIVRSFVELGPEFTIVLDHDDATASDRCTISVEIREDALDPNMRDAVAGRLQTALREELRFRPRIRVLNPATLTRTDHKSSRLEDRRQHVGRFLNSPSGK